jgi:hypothetical protein
MSSPPHRAGSQRVTRALWLGALFLGCREPATESPGPAFEQITSPAGPGSAEPNLAVDARGRVYLTWLERQADSTHALRLAILSGDTWSEPRTIIARRDLFVNWADFPSAFVTATGRIVVHWLQRSGTQKYAYDVWFSQSSDTGATWSQPAVLHRDRSAGEHGFVSFFPAAADSVDAVWLDGRNTSGHDHGGAMQLATTTVGADGGLGSEALIDNRICDCCQTSAAITSRGPVVVYRDRSEKEVRDIAILRRVDGRWTEPARVHDDNWEISACPVNGPAVAARGDTVAVAWFTGAQDTARVRVAFSTDAGATFGPPTRVDDGNPAGRVDVELDHAGRAIVTWIERTTGEEAEVRMRGVSPAGVAETPLTLATSSAARPSGFPRVARRDGGLVVAWTQPGDSGRVRVGKVRLSDGTP